jgi:hypothetical protein
MERKIRPIVIYPFIQPINLRSLKALYSWLEKKLEPEKDFHKPVTFVNNQTKYRSKTNIKTLDDEEKRDAYDRAINIIEPISNMEYVWAVDTCAIWFRGLGDAYEKARNEREQDVFWLIPGDFNYASNEGQDALTKMLEIPLEVYDKKSEICLGEIEVPINSSKQLIDTYGTYGLLYNWFPDEAKGIRKITDKPRSEFFALNFSTLENSLVEHRWFAYEQTLMILLQNMEREEPKRRINCIELGEITDEESARASLSSAMQQVERTERALKLFYRERNKNWHEDFREKDAQSESIRTAAMVILRSLIGP